MSNLMVTGRTLSRLSMSHRGSTTRQQMLGTCACQLYSATPFRDGASSRGWLSTDIHLGRQQFSTERDRNQLTQDD
jgi:hypothetical protein